jgi:hypothetical protein
MQNLLDKIPVLILKGALKGIVKGAVTEVTQFWMRETL